MVDSSLIREKGKLSKMSTLCHSLPLVATRHLLSLVVIRCNLLSSVIICCLLLYHSLLLVVPLIVIRCHSLHHSLSLDVSLVCLFINDRQNIGYRNPWLSYKKLLTIDLIVNVISGLC